MSDARIPLRPPPPRFGKGWLVFFGFIVLAILVALYVKPWDRTAVFDDRPDTAAVKP